MSLGKKIISGIVQATGLSAYRTKFASIRATFATDNPIATTRPMKNQVKLMDIRHGRDVPRRIQSQKIGSGQIKIGMRSVFISIRILCRHRVAKIGVIWDSPQFSSTWLDSIFQSRWFLLPDLYNLSGSGNCRNPNPNFYRDRGVPPRFISPIANGYYWSTCWLKE